MQIDLIGKRALVTGSTAGIGRAIAETLAANGAEVAVNGRTADRVEAAVSDMQMSAPGSRFVPAPGDVATAAGCDAVIQAAGEIDILVNNVMSAVRLTRHYGPRMRDKGWGRIVMISSESGIQIPTEMIHYGFSKTALLALTRGFAQALKASGVTVNAVLPGPTRSEGVAEMLKGGVGDGKTEADVERDFFTHARPTSLIQRFADTQEVANVVAFVCSREASAISGAPVRADGGVVLAIT